MQRETIYALSSGAPPAAVAIVRISGPEAATAVRALAGKLPEPRHATLVRLKDPQSQELLDRALVLHFPGPGSATGEDVAELHLHGGRSVVAAVLDALSRLGGLREAQPGEFTRRAFENGCIDLAEAEGLADLLTAETQSQRRAALALAGGALSRAVAAWQESLLAVSAQIEAILDFSDEGDVDAEIPLGALAALHSPAEEMRLLLEQPPAERLREGVKVAIAGPVNSGKSSLLNRLCGREAAITSPVAGTTRDLVEAPTAIGGTPIILIDTAGLRQSEDEVEAIGISRAQDALASADLILWLGDPQDCPAPDRTILVRSKADLAPPTTTSRADVAVSSKTGEGLTELTDLLVARCRTLLPAEGEVSIYARHRAAFTECLEHIQSARVTSDLILLAESLRLARSALDSVTGRAGVEDMLDGLFGRFCIGK